MANKKNDENPFNDEKPSADAEVADSGDPQYQDQINAQYAGTEAVPENQSYPPAPQHNAAPAPENNGSDNIAPSEADEASPVTVDVEGDPFEIGYSETSEHYNVETRLTPTGNPVVTIRRNGYVGDEYDIPAAYWSEFKDLLGI